MPNSKEKERVKVVVRCRPMNVKETNCGFKNVVQILPSKNSIQIFNPKDNDKEGKTFTFDAAYDSSTTQENLYKESVQPVINSVLKGFNGTIFAYGQTGTGKTYTMEGKGLDSSQKGVIPRAFEQIFNCISQSNNVQYLVRASYIEIYQEEVKDLLDENRNKNHELVGDGSGIYIKNLTSQICKSVKEMEQVMKRGQRNRKVGATDMNTYSSRSHAIFIITIEMSKTISGVNNIIVGKLNLVDLAGSERQSKSCSEGDRLKEASIINLSLSALGNVISALSNGKHFHVPYRDSKLTRLLQDSLGGNSKTLMISNIGPACYNYDESLTTLRYANRAKNIKNKPVVNEDPKDALIKQYQGEIIRLKALVESKLEKNKKSLSKYNVNDTQKLDLKVTTDKIIENQLPKTFDDKEKIREEGEREKQSLIQETHQSIETLKSRIHSMESRLLQGPDFVEHTTKQQEVLQQQAEEIKQRTQRKLELEQQLEKEEETTEELQDSHINLQQDIDRKLQKLKKLHYKLQTVKKNIADTIEEFSNDRNDLELAQNELIKEYKLNQIIIENFIPESDRKEFMSKAFYEEGSEKWKTKNRTDTIQQRLSAMNNRRRPQSEYSRKLSKLNDSPRFKSENVINLNLDCQPQQLNQYMSSEVPVIVKCAFEKALRREDDIIVDACLSKGNKSLKYERKTSAQSVKNDCTNGNDIYPKARGLVKRK